MGPGCQLPLLSERNPRTFRRLHVGPGFGGRLLRDVGTLTGNNLQKFRRRLNEVPPLILRPGLGL